MDQYQQTSETYNKLAQQYESKFMQMHIYNESYDLFCEAVPAENAEILEIAAGPGNITRFLMDKRPDFRLLGTDIAPEMIRLARKNVPEAAFKVMDFRAIHELEKKYDGVVCGFGLPYLTKDDAIQFIKNCAGLLNEGGILYLSFVPGKHESSHMQTSSDGKHSVYFHYYETPFVIEQLKSAGMAVLHELIVEFPKGDAIDLHTILIASKVS